MSDRAYYVNTIAGFKEADKEIVFAALCGDKQFPTNSQTKRSWSEEIDILQKEIPQEMAGMILLEYNIPRMGHRADTVLLANGIVILLEFKIVDEAISPSDAKRQVLDYGLDLADFHSVTHDKIVLPLAVVKGMKTDDTILKDVAGSFKFPDPHSKVADPLAVGTDDLGTAIRSILQKYTEPAFDYAKWEDADYKPSPSIIEYERELYKKHNVEDITRKGAGDVDISNTTKAVIDVINECRNKKKKAIVFVSGVPGAGKTLIGLNISNQLGDSAIFLSGNAPLVTVLKTALIRDRISQEEAELDRQRSGRARRGVQALVTDAYAFRNDIVRKGLPPTIKKAPEHVLIFDEAQRAWDSSSVESYMKEKRDVAGLSMSEPELMLKSLDQNDWCTMVCLVGGGQDIHTGETGLVEWIETIRKKFKSWSIFTSNKLNNAQYIRDRNWDELVNGLDIGYRPDLYLTASMRSFKNENVSNLINCILDNDITGAVNIYDENMKVQYHIVITQDLESARKWVRTAARGSQRSGLLVHSLAGRMDAFGIYYDKNRIQVADWFINGPDDVRSSYRMEIPASEFETQGLEIEYAIICWDADLRREDGKWAPYRFGIQKKGTTPPNWIKMSYNGDEDEKSRVVHVFNSYRVLLTRARQGMAIYVPKGIDGDATVNPEWYESIYKFLHDEIGIKDIAER